ncbi:MAG: hypothetical protein OXI24_04890 [Candidatus Poribacteria bacterium]|nr:hypothetical protein [Candidatus Poribacteria bacterium]
MYKFTIQLLALSLAVLFFPSDATAQFQTSPSEHTQEEHPEHYSESALRRFEIITLSSLPFTAIHSYAVVRGIKMYTQNQFAPELSPADYRIIGVGAVSLSVFIGFWDWLHTRKVDRSAPRIPERTPPEPPEEEAPTEGPIARLSNTTPYAAKYRNRSLQESMNKGLNRWAREPAAGLAIPLLHIRF